jgi:hypothetical protein
MKKISLMPGVLVAVLAHTAMAEEGEGQRVARACAVDFARLCAQRVAMPLIEDFQKRGHAFSCLQEYIPSGQLSQPCASVIMSGGK